MHSRALANAQLQRVVAGEQLGRLVWWANLTAFGAWHMMVLLGVAAGSLQGDQLRPMAWQCWRPEGPSCYLQALAGMLVGGGCCTHGFQLLAVQGVPLRLVLCCRRHPRRHQMTPNRPPVVQLGPGVQLPNHLQGAERLWCVAQYKKHAPAASTTMQARGNLLPVCPIAPAVPPGAPDGG